MLDELVHYQHLVQALWSAVNSGSGNLATIGPLVKRVLETGAWRRRRVIQLGKIVEFEHFTDFILTPPLEGCGWPLEKVELLIRDDRDLLKEWRRATTAPKHLHHDSDNITIKPERGTSLAYTLDRLDREQPDLYARVIAGELSANKAAIEAGWRKPPNLLKQVLKLLSGLTNDERAEVLVVLQNWKIKDAA